MLADFGNRYLRVDLTADTHTSAQVPARHPKAPIKKGSIEIMRAERSAVMGQTAASDVGAKKPESGPESENHPVTLLEFEPDWDIR